MGDAAYLWIEIATEKASFLCRDIATMKRKQKYVKDAIHGAGDFPELDGFKTQIRELENNLNVYLTSYQDSIEKLGRVEKNLFNKELNKYNKQLAQNDELSHRIKITEIVAQHYQEASTEAPINITTERI